MVDPMNGDEPPKFPLTSRARDPWASGLTIIAGLCVIGAIASMVIAGWHGILVQVNVLNGLILPAGFTIIVFWPLATTYGTRITWRLAFTERGISGLPGGRTVGYPAIATWNINGNVLMYSLVDQERDPHAFMPALRPGVPAKLRWATLERAKVPQIEQMLHQHAAPPGAGSFRMGTTRQAPH